MSTRKDVIVVGAGVIGCSITYHLGRRGISACIVDRESVAVRASGKAWAVFTCGPAWTGYEKCVTTPSEELGSGPLDIPLTVPGESVEHWLYLHTASYDRMPELAIELKERSGIDIEYCETPSTNLVTRKELEKAGGPQELLRPMREAGGVETDWIDAAARPANVRAARPRRRERVSASLPRHHIVSVSITREASRLIRFQSRSRPKPGPREHCLGSTVLCRRGYHCASSWPFSTTRPE